MKKLFLPSLFSLILLFACSPENTNTVPLLADTNSVATDDEKAVRAAIIDYVEGLYLVDSTRIERSVHPQLRKRGYWYSKEDQEFKDNLDMTYEELVGLAARWNKSGKRANASSVKTIDIYNVESKTASARLTAEWGLDYFHLAKIDGKWYIMNVLWQSLPE